MHIISKKKIRDYIKCNAQAELPLTEWYMKMRVCDAKTFSEMSKKFNSVDAVYGYTIFNVGGNAERPSPALPRTPLPLAGEGLGERAARIAAIP